MKYCKENKAVGVEMPIGERKWLSFYNYQRKQKMPFIVYADFESFTTPIQGCRNNEEKSFTQEYQFHSPSGFCLYNVPFDENIKLGTNLFVYSKRKENEDVSKAFVKILHMVAKHIYKSF